MVNPNKKRPHYRTRVVHNREFLALNNVQHFLIHYVVVLLTSRALYFVTGILSELFSLRMEDVRRSQTAAICFTAAGLLLTARLLGVL